MTADTPCPKASIRITTLFTRLFLTGAPLLKLPSVKLPGFSEKTGLPPPSFRVDPNRLLALIPTLHQNYEYFLSLSAQEINAFSMIGWGCLILSTILGFRMSFPISFCEEWDDYAARRVVRFESFLERLCKLGAPKSNGQAKGNDDKDNLTLTPATMPTTKGMDVLSASKVVFAVVRRKFRNRVAKLEGAASRKDAKMGGGMGVGINFGAGAVVGVCPVTGKASGEDGDPHHSHGLQGHSSQTQQPLPQQPQAPSSHQQHQHQYQYHNHHLQTPTPPPPTDFPHNNAHHHHQHPQPQPQPQQQQVLDIHMDLSTLPLDFEIPQAPSLHIPSTNISGCPMMDGSLEPYYPYWDETFTFNTGSPNSMGSGGSGGIPSGSGSGSAASTATGNGSTGYRNGGDRNGQQVSTADGNGVPPVGVPMMESGMRGGMGMGMNMGMGMGMGYSNNDLWAAMTMDWAGSGGGVENWA